MTTSHKIHHYWSTLRWAGSTAGGWSSYDRRHSVEAAPAKHSLTLSADPVFRGDPELLNPEQLLVAAASSCQLLSFLARAARAGIDVRSYEDRAEASMDMADTPARISHIRLAPVIEVAAGTDRAKVEALVQVAHDECYIANSLTSALTIEPTIREARVSGRLHA